MTLTAKDNLKKNRFNHSFVIKALAKVSISEDVS